MANILEWVEPIDGPACRRVCWLWRHLCAEGRNAHKRHVCCTGTAYMRTLADRGRLEVMRWARTNGCPWSLFTCSRAASSGHLKVIKWARANGCPWDALTCDAAGRNGHVGVLQWADANGCPWDEQVCKEAAWNGHLNVLKWVQASRHSLDMARCMRKATLCGHAHVVTWLESLARPKPT